MHVCLRLCCEQGQSCAHASVDQSGASVCAWYWTGPHECALSACLYQKIQAFGYIVVRNVCITHAKLRR